MKFTHFSTVLVICWLFLSPVSRLLFPATSRWQRILKRCILEFASRCSEPVALPTSPSYLPARDVSVIVPTIGTQIEFVEALTSWLANNPLEIIVVTVKDQLEIVKEFVAKCLEGTECSRTAITVLTRPYPSKRKQMAHGLKHAKGSIIVFVDDDVIWQPLVLRYLLACFEAKRVGGAGTRQRASFTTQQSSGGVSIWQKLADHRLESRIRNQGCDQLPRWRGYLPIWAYGGISSGDPEITRFHGELYQ